MAGDPGRPACADRGAHRVRQDAGRVSRGDRRAGAARAGGQLRDETQIVYVSPLKALSNDIQRNLEAPLAGVREALRAQGLARCRDPHLGAHRRHAAGRARSAWRSARRTSSSPRPESLYILLGSESGRKMLATTRTVIVDEIHALAPNKRGAHLALSLERLAALCERPPAAHRPVGHPEADRGGRARFSGRRGRWRAGTSECTDHRHRPSPGRAISRSKFPSSPLEARDVGRGLAAGL